VTGVVLVEMLRTISAVKTIWSATTTTLISSGKRKSDPKSRGILRSAMARRNELKKPQ
jgi:hypothetical protein